MSLFKSSAVHNCFYAFFKMFATVFYTMQHLTADMNVVLEYTVLKDI